MVTRALPETVATNAMPSPKAPYNTKLNSSLSVANRIAMPYENQPRQVGFPFVNSAASCQAATRHVAFESRN